MSDLISTLHINTEPTWRGGEQQTLYLLSGLKQRGYPVLLCAQKGSPMAQRAFDAGIETAELRMRGEIDPIAVVRLARCIRRFRPEIVQFHTSHAHTLGVLAAALTGRGRPRTLLTRRVDFSIYRHSFFGLNHIKYRNVDQIVAISEAIRKVLLDDGIAPEGIACVPSGIDTARFEVEPCDLRREHDLPPTTKIVANVAFFADHKGQKYLVEAAPRILQEFPDCAIFLIGEGPLREPLRELAGELGVGHRVFFPGFRTDIPAILRGIDLYVMPSHNEGLGTSVLDALWCEVPLVAADAGGIPEIVHHEENGLLVPPRDSEAVADAVLRLFRSPDEAKRFAAAGPAVVESNYTADKMVEGNIRVYRELLGRV